MQHYGMPIGMFLLATMVSVIGYLIHSRVTSVDDTVKATRVTVDETKTELVEVKTKQTLDSKHFSEQIDELCTRVGAVEQTINNTERIVKLEAATNATSNEISLLRQHHHDMLNKINQIALAVQVKEASVKA